MSKDDLGCIPIKVFKWTKENSHKYADYPGEAESCGHCNKVFQNNELVLSVGDRIGIWICCAECGRHLIDMHIKEYSGGVIYLENLKKSLDKKEEQVCG